MSEVQITKWACCQNQVAFLIMTLHRLYPSGCGQYEPLTTRIKGLLEEDYTDGLAVFKELIQNADDAGATEVI